jgi:hypothetical protein
VPIDAERFAAAAAWVDEADGTALPTVALFGGALADGTYDDRLFVGKVEVGEAGNPLVRWSLIQLDPTAPRPAGRADALLAVAGPGSELILAGGEDETGALDEVWAFDPERRAWRERTPLPFPLSGAAAGMRGRNTAYVFGGDTDSGLSGELYLLDLTTSDLRDAGMQAGGPGPRRDVRLVVEGEHTVFVFGGTDAAGIRHNDLWRANLRDGAWTQVRSDCAGPRCPIGEGAALLLAAGREPLVLGGYSGAPGNEHGYQLRGGRWLGPGEVTGVSLAFEDCDGDGLHDEGYGELCRNQGQWWAPVGQKVCAEDGGLVCNAMEAEVEALRTYWMALPWTMEADLERGIVYLMGWDWVDVVRVERGDVPQRLVRLWLDAVGYDMARYGDRLYVGSDEGVEIFDVFDPLAAVKVGELDTGSAVYEVAAAGGRLIILDDSGIKVLRPGSEAGEPPAVAGEIPIEELRTDEPWFGWSLGFTPPGKLASAGELGFLSGELGIWVLDLEDREAPVKAEYVSAGFWPGDLRMSDQVVYASGLWNLRLDMRSEDPIVEWGHEVRPWVKGRALENGMAVRLSWNGLRIAELGRSE